MKTDVNQTLSNLFISSDFFENPYPFYEELRSNQPICWANLLKQPGWYVTGYKEAVAILKDSRFENRMPLPEASKKYTQLKNIQSNMMLFKNQPDHKRLRLLVSQIFTPGMIERQRSYIQDTADDLLQSFRNKKTIDVVSEFAYPLTSMVIAKILGIPEEDRHQFKEWAAGLVPTIDFTRSRKVLDNGDNLAIFLTSYFKTLIEKRKFNPGEDLISLLIKEEQLGERLTAEELVATCILLVIAGHETTVNLISNSVLSLLKYPEQMNRLKDNPMLIERAVEEFLRFESPTQMTARMASEEIQINHATIKKGEQVYILLGAANRDPNQFHYPHILDITRNPNPHLAFGQGTHFCLGAPLARLEAQIAIQSLLANTNNIQLATTNIQFRKWIGFRALNTLQIAFD
ncbi:cytochrome P450 [Neobacillus kokaensis]|uniref:Biotin biosynthesis cytochrome P450 n=1 Tax=Neobacillus kokaensis TaxID=2759023 RepID=A0ABQ3N7D2_9BACI|nr:cytochrome P450 [Neobacillus kokaensis]GHH99423.1 biotin biosynthesis cytochrome P450 [Neobacillus kokaensis]